MKRYPSLPFDSPKIRSQREIAQRAIGEEDVYSSFTCRPFTIYVSTWIAEKTKWSANSITCAMAVFSLFAPFLVWQISSPVFSFAFALLSFLFILFLDVLDGEIARMRGETSEFGKWVDSALWFTLTGLTIVVLWKANEAYLQMSFLPAAILMGYLLKLFAAVSFEIHMDSAPTHDKTDQAPVKTSSFKSSIPYFLLRGVLERPSIYLYFFIIALAGAISGVSVAIPAGILLICVLLLDLAISIKKLVTVTRRLRKIDDAPKA